MNQSVTAEFKEATTKILLTVLPDWHNRVHLEAVYAVTGH